MNGNDREKYIYGPVPSRRLGFSLGVDLVPYKTCSFDCIYCQLGRTTDKTVERKEYVPAGVILSQLEEILSSNPKVDYITLSGSGEPTLNSGIGEVIRGIKGVTSIPVAVLTNGCFLYDEEVRRDLLIANAVLPSLDAVREKTFQAVNRPHQLLDIHGIVKGLKSLRREFKGKIWLEVMLVKGVNDSLPEIKGLKRVISQVEPDRVQLNTVARPPSEEFANPLSEAELEQRKDLLGGNCEIIAHSDEERPVPHSKAGETAIIELLRRRPVTLQEISTSLGIHRNEAIKCLRSLEQNRMIKVHHFRGLRYYQYE